MPAILESAPVEHGLMAVARVTPGVRKIRRPATGLTPEFDLSYVRTKPTKRGPALPVAVVIPGGPGLGSILPYRTLRGVAARGGLDLIMVEHRGVGLSRLDIDGRDLPISAMRITEVLDDIAAVLDHEGVQKAYLVGSSYGSYLASSFGIAHPERVAGMLLDSALQSADELELERSVIRGKFWDNSGEVADAVRRLSATGIDQRVLLDVVRAAYELGGDDLLLPLLQSRLRARHDFVWNRLQSFATRDASIARIPGIYDFDLVGAIGFRELGYGALPDGLPLDPALTYAPLIDNFPAFEGEPYDLSAGVPNFRWPVVLLCGRRDLRTPPAIAERVAAAAPDSVMISINAGHSALDTHPMALLNALKWLVEGRQAELPAAAARIDRLPLRGFVPRAPQLLAAGLRVERLLEMPWS